MSTQTFVITEGVRHEFTTKPHDPSGVSVWLEGTKLVIRDKDGKIGEMRGNDPERWRRLLGPLGDSDGPGNVRRVTLEEGDQMQLTTSSNELLTCVWLDVVNGAFEIVGGDSIIRRIEGKDLARRLKCED